MSGYAIKGSSFYVDVFLEPHIYLTLGYCIIIQANSWFEEGVVIEENPNPSYSELGIHLQFCFNGV